MNIIFIASQWVWGWCGDIFASLNTLQMPLIPKISPLIADSATGRFLSLSFVVTSKKMSSRFMF